jgi:3-oxoacyl-[acyl-carrier protein] reductase
LKIEGAVALVTGAAQGLGLVIAQRLARAGAIVVAADRDARALAKLPPDLFGIEVDVTNPEQVKRATSRVVERHGAIGVLVNNAGVIFSEPFVNIMNPVSMMHDYDRFRASLLANLDSVFLMTSAVVEQMIKSRTKGVVVNISSISACGNVGQTAYSAAKAGVNAMTVTWSKELSRWGIRTNALAPGFISTDSTRKAVSEATLEHLERNTPLRRLGFTEEVAHAAVALIENDFINGEVLHINGGLRI